MSAPVIEATEIRDTELPQTTLLAGLTQRVNELGRIRLGEKTETGAPRRLTTFRFTSASKTTLEAAAALYGGTVRKWEGAPDEGMWELKTTVAELDILIPGSLPVIGQSYEFWQGGTCERRCDGTTETASGVAQPCLCAAAGLSGADRVCDIVTRLRVVLPRIPGLGVWRLDTSGFFAATTLPSTINMLARLTPGAWIPAILRAAQRSTKVRDDKGKVTTHRFVVPEIDLPGVTIGAIVGGSAPAQIEAGERATPPTAAERVAQRRAELEAQAGGSAVDRPGSTDQAHVGGTEAATSTADASKPAPANADHPAARMPCPVRSPRGALCDLAGGHSGDHKRANVTWPTPTKSGGLANEVGPSHDAAEPGETPAEPDEAAEVVTPAASADLVQDADFREVADETLGDLVKPTQPVVAGENDPSLAAGMDLLNERGR